MVVLGRAARNAANIKNRQPIGTMYVKRIMSLTSILRISWEDELNVKEVRIPGRMSAILPATASKPTAAHRGTK